MSLNGNDYFTYFFDGNTEGCHRSGTQVKSVSYGGFTYDIYLAGNYTEGGINKYNAFAKKHLITFRGGKSHAQGGRKADPRHKAEQILGSRFNNTTLTNYNNKRNNYRATLEQDNQGQYPVRALGGAVTKKNTVVICDYIDPNEMWEAFARGLHAKKPWQTGQSKTITVDFNLRVTSKDYCVISSNASGIIDEEGTAIRVTAYCANAVGKSATCHIVHFDGVG